MINKFFQLLSPLAAFLVGGIPTGYLLGRFYGMPDIRQHGSGNIGASNAGRIFGITSFLIVFCIDAGKAFLFLLSTESFKYDWPMILLIASLLLLGNCYSPFLAFNGGKGVATLMGIVGYISLPFMAVLSICWLVLLYLLKSPGYASLLLISGLPVASMFLFAIHWTAFFIFAALLIFYRHKKNLLIN